MRSTGVNVPTSTVFIAARVANAEVTGWLPDHAVLVDDGRISAVTPASQLPSDVESNYTVLDLGDVSLLPGLCDAHCHMHCSAGPNAQEEALTEKPDRLLMRATNAMRRILMSGTTTVRDIGARNDVSFAVLNGIRIRRYPRPAADLHRYTNHNHVRPLLVLRHGGRHQRAGGAGDSQAGQTRRAGHQDDGHRRHVHAHRKPPYAPVRRRHAARGRVRSRAAQRADRRSYVVGAGHAKLRRGRNSSTDTRPMARLRPGEEAGVRSAGRRADGGKRPMGGPDDRAPPPRGRGACR